MRGKPQGRRAVRIVLLCGLIGAVGACTSKTSDNSIQPVAVRDLALWLRATPGKYLVIDIRDESAFAAGHIPGARRITLPEVDPDDPAPSLRSYSAIIVCGEDPGSAIAKAMAKRLIGAKVTEVYLLEGGMAAWRGGGQRTTSSAEEGAR